MHRAGVFNAFRVSHSRGGWLLASDIRFGMLLELFQTAQATKIVRLPFVLMFSSGTAGGDIHSADQILHRRLQLLLALQNRETVQILGIHSTFTSRLGSLGANELATPTQQVTLYAVSVRSDRTRVKLVLGIGLL